MKMQRVRLEAFDTKATSEFYSVTEVARVMLFEL